MSFLGLLRIRVLSGFLFFVFLSFSFVWRVFFVFVYGCGFALVWFGFLFWFSKLGIELGLCTELYSQPF